MKLAAAFVLGLALGVLLRKREPIAEPLAWRESIDVDYV